MFSCSTIIKKRRNQKAVGSNPSGLINLIYGPHTDKVDWYFMATGIYLQWGAGWYLISAFILVIWVLIMRYRKDYRLRPQIMTGLVLTGIALIIENIAIFYGLWNYAPGNWPLILWPNYFLSGLAAYQVVRLTDERKNRK